MKVWDVFRKEVAGQIVYEVLRIDHAEQKEHTEKDFLRLDTFGLFDKLPDAVRLAERLNEEERKKK